MRKNNFYGKNILSVKQFCLEDLWEIFETTRYMQSIVSANGSIDLLKGKLIANLFYEPSTRTSTSFAAAIKRLGGDVISINEVHYSSVAKGESLPDTIRTLECYVDAIVLRHPEMGASNIASQYANKPIINAGDGTGEHPTQALLDLFTIIEEKKSIHGLTITLCGDLKYGRTVHSLVRLLSLFTSHNLHLNLVSPESLSLPRYVLQELKFNNISFYETSDLNKVIEKTDILYVTRVQKERFAKEADYNMVKDTYVISPRIMERANSNMILMHPFPRVKEISMHVDDDPRAAYFRQMKYGLFLRMALLSMILCNN